MSNSLELLYNLYPVAETAVSGADGRNFQRLVSMGRLSVLGAKQVVKTTKEAMNEAKQYAIEDGRRGRKFKDSAITLGNVAYTVGDDFLIAMPVYGALTEVMDPSLAAISWGAIASLLAIKLGDGVRNRRIGRIKERGEDPVEINNPITEDLVTTYGGGVPLAVGVYPKNTVPSPKRVKALGAFYGLFGQGVTYLGLGSVAEVAGINEKLFLTGAIGAILTRKYMQDSLLDPDNFVFAIHGTETPGVDGEEYMPLSTTEGATA